MAKTVVLAEKPSVAKDIARVLRCNKAKEGYIEGDHYIVTWALGHLVTLADPEAYDKKYKTWQLEDLPMLPKELRLTVIKQSGKQFNAVKKQLQRPDVTEIVIATDAGREGELVARWIIQMSQVKKPMKRLWISSVTDRAIQQGFSSLKPAKQFEHLFDAAVARARADWYVGLNITRALTTKFNAQLNSGRVQTPVVQMIAKREEAIANFKPKQYFTVQVTAQNLVFHWKPAKQKQFDSEYVARLIKQTKEPLEIVSIDTKTKVKSAPLLYDLTELQRDAYHQFGYSAKETLAICQRLYEHYKIVTYPRTDSRYLSSDMVSTMNERIKACATGDLHFVVKDIQLQDIAKNKQIFNDKLVSDHHAIIPTEQSVMISKLSFKEQMIYQLIVKRFLATLLPKQELQEVTVTASFAKETFHLSEQIVTKVGWGAVYEQETSNQSLPYLQKGTLPVQSIKKTEQFTKAPSYFNEASLLSAMENPTAYMETDDQLLKKTLQQTGGLGTVATRADIIDKLFKSFMIEKKGENIVTTGKGKQLLELVPTAMKSPELTSKWELQLEQIATGKLAQQQFIQEIKEYTKQLVQEVKQSDGKFKHDNLTTKRCPDCNKPLLEVNGKKGKMLVCQDRLCGYRKNLARITNARCPECHKKLELVGEGDKQLFVCKCGYREKLTTFQERKKQQGSGKADKRSVQQYLKKQEKEEPINTALFDALKNLQLHD